MPNDLKALAELQERCKDAPTIGEFVTIVCEFELACHEIDFAQLAVELERLRNERDECRDVLNCVLDTEAMSHSVRGAIQGCVNVLSQGASQGDDECL